METVQRYPFTKNKKFIKEMRETVWENYLCVLQVILDSF